METEDTVTRNVTLPAAQWRELKIKSAIKGISIKSLISRAIDCYLKKGGNDTRKAS